VDLAAGPALRTAAPLPQDAAVEALAESLLPAGPIYVGFAPGAGGKHKCWPLERFCEVANRLATTGTVPVFLLGPAEGDWAGILRATVPTALLPLQQVDKAPPMLTIALARRMKAALANDSGTGHMLAAADIALVSLFGPTPPDKFAPSTGRLTVLRAQDFGGSAMDSIPLPQVEKALAKCLL
jgi:ADP-heptose:LPS heptosyltransferase